MTNIYQSIIDDAKQNDEGKLWELFNTDNYHVYLMENGAVKITNHGKVTVLPSLDAMLDELTLKRNAGEAVAYMDTAGNLVKDCHLNSMRARGEELTPLYLSPPQPQTVVRALDKAAKICERDYLTYKETEDAHYRFSPIPFDPRNFAFDMAIVNKSKQDAEAIRALITNPTQEAQGWKLVPIELTKEQAQAMIWAYEKAMGGDRLPDGDSYDFEIVQKMHEAMLASAPNKGD